MRQHRYTAPLDLIESQPEPRQQCPYCRWRVSSMYRLECWAEDDAGCADCVLNLLSEDEYDIYATHPGDIDTSCEKRQSPPGAHADTSGEQESTAG